MLSQLLLKSLLMAHAHIFKIEPAFWSNAYSALTFYVSESTTRDSPVGVDFYRIGERGNQFGPFGALYPLQMYNQSGRGIWRCSGPPTTLFNMSRNV